MLLVDATTAEHAPGGIRTVAERLLEAAAAGRWRREVAAVLGPSLVRPRRVSALRLPALTSKPSRLAYQRLGLGLHAGVIRGARRIERVLALDAYTPWLRLGGARHAVFVHDLLALTHPGYWSPLEVAVKRNAFEAIRRLRPVVFTSTAHNAGLVRRALGAEARVAPFGCGLLTDAEAEEALRRQPRRVEDVVLYLGAIEERKDIATLLAGFERAAPALGVDARLLLAGRPTPRWRVRLDAWRARSLHGSRVAVLDGLSRPDALALLRRARVLVYPSRAEGFGLPVLEGLALGVPVVASGLREIEAWAGDACAYFPPGDAAALADALSGAWKGGSPAPDRGLEVARGHRWTAFADALFEGW